MTESFCSLLKNSTSPLLAHVTRPLDSATVLVQQWLKHFSSAVTWVISSGAGAGVGKKKEVIEFPIIKM